MILQWVFSFENLNCPSCKGGSSSSTRSKSSGLGWPTKCCFSTHLVNNDLDHDNLSDDHSHDYDDDNLSDDHSNDHDHDNVDLVKSFLETHYNVVYDADLHICINIDILTHLLPRTMSEAANQKSTEAK